VSPHSKEHHERPHARITHFSSSASNSSGRLDLVRYTSIPTASYLHSSPFIACAVNATIFCCTASASQCFKLEFRPTASVLPPVLLLPAPLLNLTRSAHQLSLLESPQ
jgi:hypothetical protein